MILSIQGQQLTTEQIGKGKYEKQAFSEDSHYLIDFIRSWVNENYLFTFETSGSTGKPKKIQLTKEILQYSATATLKYLNFDHSKKSSFLLPISPKFIGGIMVAVRALVSHSNLVVVNPKQLNWTRQKFFTASFVPLQIEDLLQKESQTLQGIDHILIGGASLDPALEKKLIHLDVTAYHTYGMTETASHVALRQIGTQQFKAIGDARFKVRGGALSICGTVTDQQWLQTNDLVDLISETSFVWKGRSDFVINSGGYKIQPEKVEAKLAGQLQAPFMISSIPDLKFENKVVLITEEQERPVSFQDLHPYERPKSIFFEQVIVRTPSGKPDRNKTRENLIKQINA